MNTDRFDYNPAFTRFKPIKKPVKPPGDEQGFIEDPELGRIYYTNPDMTKRQKDKVSKDTKKNVSAYKRLKNGNNNSK